MEVWKISGEGRYFVRFGKEDTLIFDIRYLTPEQHARLLLEYPDYRGFADTTGNDEQITASLACAPAVPDEA